MIGNVAFDDDFGPNDGEASALASRISISITAPKVDWSEKAAGFPMSDAR